MRFFSVVIFTFFFLHSGGVQAAGNTIRFNDSCDTFTKKEFLSLSKLIYNRLQGLASFSDSDKIKAIKVYNTIFLLKGSRIKNKGYIKNYQIKFDKYYRYAFPLDDNSIIESSKVPVFFTKLGVSLWGDFQIKTGHITCRDMFFVK